jgi:hypothetical protein
MRVDELKLRVNTYLSKMIDSFFPKGNLITGITNATLKFYIEQNMYVVEDYIKPFADRDGDIDSERFLCLLEDHIFQNGSTSLDITPYIREYVPENFSNLLPDKIIINKEDLVSILSEKKRAF